MKFLILLAILVGCSNGEKIPAMHGPDVTCIDGVTYIENGFPIANNYSLTVKLGTDSKIVPCK